MDLKRLAVILSCGATIAFAALAQNAASSTDRYKRINMTPLSPRLQHLFANAKTVCFGRFTIEVPSSATVVFGRMTVENEIAYAPGEGKMVDKRIAEELTRNPEKTLFKEVHQPDSLYRHIVEGGLPGQKSLVGANDGDFYLRSYAPVGSGLFIFESNGIFTTEEVKKEIASIESIARRLRPLAEGEIPAEPGICLEGGFINLYPKYENLSVGLRLAEFPDVHLSIDMLKNRNDVYEELDLDRQMQESADDARRQGGAAWYARIKMLRHGPRMIGDWDGKEALAYKPAQKTESASHQFVFQAVGHPTDPLRPQVKVELFTGVDANKIGGKHPSLSDAETVALWDKLTGSIRVRPTSPPKSAHSGPPPLGSTVQAGQPCPQEGWWDCGDEGDGIEAINGRRQFFRLRDRMPQAVLSRRKTMLQRLSREQPTFQSSTPTIWTLLEYDQATVERIAALQPDAAPATANGRPSRAD